MSRSILACVALLVGLAGCRGCGDSRPERLTFTAEALSGVDQQPTYGGTARSTILEINGPPVALVDVDGDSDLDVYLGYGGTIERAVQGRAADNDRLLLNDGNGVFSDATGPAGLQQTGWAQGIAVGDFDSDGDRDLYVTNWGANALLRNDGGRFTNVAPEAGVADERWGTSAAFGDVDGDGDPDLYVANYLRFDARYLPAPTRDMPCRWKGVAVSCGPEGLVPQPDALYLNNGDGTFSNVSDRVRTDRPAFGLGVLMADVDDDSDLDIVVANDSTPNFLFVNDGTGHFREDALFAGLSHSGDGQEQAGMGLALGDPNGDALPDIVMTHFSEDHHTLFRGSGHGLFTDASFDSGLAPVSLVKLGWGAVFADFDLDGDEDLYVAHGHVYPAADRVSPRSGYGQRDHLYLNDGAGRFDEQGVLAGLSTKDVSRAAAGGDIDGDGDTDLLVVRLDAPPKVLRNQGVLGTRALVVQVDGGPGNPDGVGARVDVALAGRTQVRWLTSGGSFQAASDPRARFGVAEDSGAATITVRWPNGRVTTTTGEGPVVRVGPPTAE